MLTRLAIIVSLLWQPFAASASTVRPDDMPDACHARACCELVTRTTCCGETIVERVCPMAEDGVCPCGVRGSDDPAPQREAPKTCAERDRVHMAKPTTVRPVFTTRADGTTRSVVAVFSTMHVNRSHNSVRALLSNWRT